MCCACPDHHHVARKTKHTCCGIERKFFGNDPVDGRYIGSLHEPVPLRSRPCGSEPRNSVSVWQRMVVRPMSRDWSAIDSDPFFGRLAGRGITAFGSPASGNADVVGVTVRGPAGRAEDIDHCTVGPFSCRRCRRSSSRSCAAGVQGSTWPPPCSRKKWPAATSGASFAGRRRRSAALGCESPVRFAPPPPREAPAARRGKFAPSAESSRSSPSGVRLMSSMVGGVFIFLGP